ncbi:indirect negative regulator of sigma-B activity [Aquibacillus sediminis]|uniref:indirect negative regulator of sigma-B activity n=1 Tax=Aquibacillus sediminis TaxID=2574734 RepID=UPI0011084B18|nr:indirect negative regulator of sigma-B activity [Aquibacillus sediminis]
MGTDNCMDVSVYQKAKEGNYYCGDSYFFKEKEDEFICALADGLGSGEYAKESSEAVMEMIEQNPEMSVKQLMKQAQKVLIGKRGVVLGILKINFHANNFSFSSVGNIGLMTITSNCKKQRNIPNAGYLGGYERPVKVLEGAISDGMMFLMFSDGVRSSDLSSTYLYGKDVQTITSKFPIQDDRPTDDTTLIAMKYKK